MAGLSWCASSVYSTRSRSSGLVPYRSEVRTRCHLLWLGTKCKENIGRFDEWLIPYNKNQESDRREGKGHRCCWLGDRIECCTSHLAARMIWRKALEEHPFLEGWWFSVVYPFFYSSFCSNHPGAKCSMKLNQICPPNQQRRPLPSLLSDSYSMVDTKAQVMVLLAWSGCPVRRMSASLNKKKLSWILTVFFTHCNY